MSDPLKAAEAGKRLGLSARKMYALAQSGDIAYYKFGSAIRFELADLEDYRRANQPGRPLLTPRILREAERLRQRIPQADRPLSSLSPAQLEIAQKRTRRLRMAPWADSKAIRAIYAEAKRLTLETGIPHHVDHEIPLQGDFVSGLHVHTNLKVLPGAENMKKHNHFEIEP